jgi:putative ABC transport system ATP-binding protein
MLLHLDRLLPSTLTPLSRRSELWEQQIEFAPGERVYVQAPSGTGKTTLIHLLYGLRTDTAGTISWGGKTLKSMNPEDLSRLRSAPVSVVFQDLRLFPDLTAWENLTVKHALGSDVRVDELEQWVSRLGLTHRRNALASTLSYGERQRIAILRALIQPFQWLLLDEPFSHLDLANAGKAATLIEEVCTRRNAGMLYADLDANTHFNYSRVLHL